jgi:hypothetical protein
MNRDDHVEDDVHTLVFLLGVLHQPHEAQRFFIAAVPDTVRDLRFNHLSEDIDIIRDFDRSFYPVGHGFFRITEVGTDELLKSRVPSRENGFTNKTFRFSLPLCHVKGYAISVGRFL